MRQHHTSYKRRLARRALHSTENEALIHGQHQPDHASIKHLAQRTAVGDVSPETVLSLQRTVGNKAVQRLLAKRSPTAPSQPETIHRKVYIKGKPAFFKAYGRKRTTTRGDVGEGDRKVSVMMQAQDKKYYFHNKDEMERYARGETENVGFVPGTNTWIRLPDELLVVGENHNEKTLHLLVNAVRTDKFMHEAYTDLPEGAEEGSGIHTLMQQSYARHNQRFGSGENAPSHISESFFPKVLRGITGVFTANGALAASQVETGYLRLALAFAPSSDPGSDLRAFYDAHQDVLDQGATDLQTKGLNTAELGTLRNRAVLKGFVDAFIAYAKEKINAERNTAPAAEKRKFDRRYRLGERGETAYLNDEMNEAEKSRDLSMWLHIKKASENGYKLYGLGDMHRVRLKKVLDNAGIKHVNMDNFIAEQQRKYPQ